LQDPEWLRWYYDGQTQNIVVYSLYADGKLCGIAPFFKRQWPLRWQIGELTLAEFPLKRFRFLGGILDFPEDEAVYDLLFKDLAKSEIDFDTVYLESVPCDSFFWRYLHESNLIRKLFVIYQPDAPSPRLLLRFSGTFKEYMSKFSSKHRKNLNREIKKLKEGEFGELRFARYEHPEQVTPFLKEAVALSRKTYQWVLHQRGLYDPDLLEHRLPLMAERHWMRCYILFCGETARAFLLGYQQRGRFLFYEIGFDPALAKYSVGTVMQLLAVEDLFNYNRPEVMDLGDYGGYKQVLSTESYLQGKMFLFRRRRYIHIMRSGDVLLRWANRALSALLNNLHCKATIKKWMRGWNKAT
jgi:hypothetical protein